MCRKRLYRTITFWECDTFGTNMVLAWHSGVRFKMSTKQLEMNDIVPTILTEAVSQK
jgi:hypothetical protein